MTDVADISADLATLREERDAALMRMELRQLQAALGKPLMEAWGDPVDRTEYLRDDPSFNFGAGYLAYTSLDDRKDGRLRPIYETEQDLAEIRAASRNLATLTGIRTGVLDTLTNYVLGGGFKYTTCAENDADPFAVGLARAVQDVIDRFIDENDFCGAIDREIHKRSREDGECFIGFDSCEIRCGKVLVEFYEPDQITEPASTGQLEEWGEVAELTRGRPSCWKFGVHTPAGRTARVLGYHVVRDGVGMDWDYIPATRMEHIKRNATINAKRGVSDFYEVLRDLIREAKLCRNMIDGAALQAAIAWIIQGAQGQTKSQLENLTSGQLTGLRNVPGPTGVVTQQRVNQYPSATTLKVGYGQEYLAGPMGSERNAGFEVAGQYALRHIGVRWNMPEYMISGDASNGNYSSTLVAESPFVKARESDQQFERRHHLSLLWKVVRLHADSGRFARFGVTYEDIERLVRIDAECPTVASRDPKVAVDSDKVLVDGGIMSKQTWAARNDLDYEKEQKLGAKEAAPPPSPLGLHGLPVPGMKPPPTPEQVNHETQKAAVVAAMESVTTTAEAKAILQEIYP